MVYVTRASKLSQVSLPILGTLALIGLWQLITGVFAIIDPRLLPSPYDVLLEFIRAREIIFANLQPTLIEAAVGFVAATTLGIGMAVLLTANEWLRDSLMPLILGGNTVPKVALAPVLIFYIGGVQAKYLLAAWIAFFPILINTMEGLNSLKQEEERLLESLSATTWQTFSKVRFMRALPFIFDGLKIGVNLAIVGAIVAEFVAGTNGIGNLAILALESHSRALVFATVLVMSLVAVTVFFALFFIQDRVITWRESSLFPE